MTDLSDYATDPTRVIPEGAGIKVGPNPEPEPVPATIIYVEFRCLDGSIIKKDFEIPGNTYAQRMEVGLKKADGKNLGPVIVTPFAWHEDSKRIHTMCRREIPFDELPPEPDEINGPSDEIETVEW